MNINNNFIFNLSEKQLRPIVENIAGEPVESFKTQIKPHTWKHYGVRGDKAIAQFNWETKAGKEGKALIFAKKQCDPFIIEGEYWEPRPVEEHHYRFLSQFSAPIPKFYGAITIKKPKDKEIIFLEYLEKVITEQEPWAKFQNDSKLFYNYLDALARFNAIKPKGKYAGLLDNPHRHVKDQMEIQDLVGHFIRFWNTAKDNKLGEKLRKICTNENYIKLNKLLLKVGKLINQMKIGFSAGDHEPFQTGVRKSTGEVLLFDFELTGFAPRFYDASITLGSPDEYVPRCAPQKELAEYYLKQYKQAGGESVKLQQFLLEIRDLWISWIVFWINCTDDAEKGSINARDLLFHKIDILLNEAGEK